MVPLPLLSVALLTLPAFSQSLEQTRAPGTLPGPTGLGTQVTRLGDTNGDGFEDFAVWGLQNQFPQIGIAYVRSGEDGSVLHSAIVGGGVEHFANALAATGDLNGDGVQDFAMGGWRMVGATAQRFVRVFSGTNSSPLYTIPYDPSLFPAGDGMSWGTTIAELDDLNGDGVADIAIGAPIEGYLAPSSGSVYLHSGADGSPLLRVPTPGDAMRFGRAVVPLGDISGDGIGDCLVSAPDTDIHGAVYAISGSNGSKLYEVHGFFDGESFGNHITSLGDVDNDGFADFAVGTYRGTLGATSHARLEVYSGVTGNPIYNMEYANQGTLFIVDMAPTADANGDGVPDLLLGTRSTLGTYPGLGLTLHVSGTDGTVIDSQPADAKDQSIESLATLGDLNGDGSPDWVIGSSSTISLAERGLVQIMLGGCQVISSTICMVPPNSTGMPGAIEAVASGTSLNQGLMQLRIVDLPPHEFGFVLMSSQTASTPLGGSTLCLGVPLIRLNTQDSGLFMSDESGYASRLLDWNAFSLGTLVLPGSTWNFQIIHRDRNMPANFHLTPALSVTF
ncbi:MAG: hypothetical protein GY930_10100 [bacterium]|nr:hypothetical protein [bacterium]